LVDRARLDPAGEAARLGIGLNDGLGGGTISATAKQPLAFNPLLIDAARGHSEWMLATDTFSHTGAGGSSPGDRMAHAGYAFTGSWTWGENISIRWGGGVSESAGIVEGFHDGLFRSAGHRANILSDGFKEVGIGIGIGEYRGSTGADATQNFARSGGSTFLTGVAFDDRDGDRFYDPGEGLGRLNVAVTSSSGATFATTTWDAGGYQLALPAGTYTVTFSGGGLAAPVSKAATVGSANVKVDLDADAAASPAPQAGGVAMAGTGGNDSLVGGAGNDSLSGAAGRDVLRGASGNDSLRGDTGNDSMAGGAGDDVLVAGDGADWLNGGAGADRLFGNAGADSFGFLSVADGRDVIGDFRRAEGDRINLSAIDADPRTAGDQAFLFADGMNFVAYQPGTVRTFRGASTTTVEVDTGQGVLSLEVQGVVAFRAEDFIL
jgi:serralysin